MKTVPTDEEKLEKVARELCLAAGKNPDAMVRLGEPLSYAAGDCTIVKPLFVPTWKSYSREARRLAMSDAEHADCAARPHRARRKHILMRLLRSPRAAAIVLRRRVRHFQWAPRLRAICIAFEKCASARLDEASSHR